MCAEAPFKEADRHSNNREKLISALFSGILAIAAGRALALLLPYRLRPIHDDSLNFVIPYGITPGVLKGWSSFPSDHAVLFFALSTSLFFIYRKVGIFVTIYTIFFIALPRIYLGLHHPTDIIVGALIGIIITLIVNFYFVKSRITGLLVDWSYAKPDFFYPLFFLFTYQIAELFDSTRTLLRFGSKLNQKIILTFF